MNNIVKKIVAITVALTVSVWLIGPGVAQAVTAEELQAQIDALMATLTDLQAQLAELTGEAPTVAGCTITSFDRNLKQGMSGDDVNCLQIVLNSATDTQLASSGVGSSGNETSYFGPLTKGGVIKFQEKYADEVLASWGLTSGTGFVGTTTRAKLNTLLVAPAEEEEEEEEEEEVAAGLTVGLSADTPVAASVPKGGNTDFTKFTLTAGSEGSVSISKIYVTRSGLSANSDVHNIKIIDVETGVHKGSVGSLNVDNRAMITFLPNLVISAGTSNSYYIRAGATTGSVTGNVIVLGIADADDIVSNASEVNGLPVTGNGMVILATVIGTVQVTWDGTVSDSTPDVGDTDVVVNQFKATVGATEAVIIEQITVKKSGSADASDTNNIELYDVTNSVSLGTVDAWDIEDKASWSDLDLSVGKGKTQRFKIMLDIADGPSKTVNVDLTDGSDVMMSVKGDNYGFYITPTVTNSWTGKGGTGTAVPQTINTGALNIAKSADTPATGSIAVADDMTLGAFDFDSRGEDIKITTLSLTITTVDVSGACSAAADFCADDITNLTIYDEDDNIVAGPKDAATATNAASDFAFTDTFILPVGIHTYSVIGDISTHASTLDTIIVSVKAPQTEITATGMTSNDTIDGTSLTPDTDVDANTLTVAAGYLSAVTLTQPVARNVSAGITDFIWATASLSASISGEDVQVTAVIVEDTLGDAADDSSTIDNMEIWADLTTESSARGDIYETKVSNTEQPDDTDATTTTDETQSFTLTQTVTVPKGSYIKIAVVADLAAGSTPGDQHIISLDEIVGGVTATGADTGSSISVQPTGSGQQMTVSAGGVLTLTRDSSSPQVDIVLGTEIVTLGIFRLAASNVEDLDLDSIYLSVTNGTYVDTYYFYHGDTLLQTAPSGTTPYVAIADGTVTIPANGNVKLTVKAKIQNMANLTNDTTITVNTSGTYKIDATGLASGSAVDSSDVLESYGMDAYETRPYFALNSATPSGTLIPASVALLAIFDVTAASYEDVTFEKSSSSVTVQISTVNTDTDGTDTDFTLRDKDGIALSTVPAADDATSVQFLFEDNAFTVPAGQTKQLYIYANTLDWEDDGDTIQLWLDDGTVGNIDWSIDSDGNAYADADKIFRGDLFAGAFVNPS